MKNFLLVLVLAVVISVSGCQTSKGFCEDVAGMAQCLAEKLKAGADKASERDADLSAKRLAERQAILDSRVRIAKNEVR